MSLNRSPQRSPRQLLTAAIAAMFIQAAPVYCQQVQFTQTSDPAGIVSQATLHPVGTDVTTVNAPLESGTNRFTHWTLNGVRTNDFLGCALNPVRTTITVETAAVAHYTNSTVDSDADGVGDWYEWYYTGTPTNDGSSDSDGDGYTLTEEFQRDYQPLIKDRVVAGGLSRRQSALTTVRITAKQYVFTSDPAGLVNQSGLVETGTVVQTQNLQGDNGAYTFGYWTIEGVRQSDSLGRSLSQLSFTVTNDFTAVAHYFGKTEDTDVDGLPDWWEWLNFGILTYDGTSDVDGDGYTLAQEYRRDYEPLIKDRIVAGGISRRQSALTTVRITAKQYAFTSDPAGLVNQSGLVETGTVVQTQNLQGDNGAYTFGYWTVEGVRQADSLGRSLSQLSFTVTNDLTAVAHYFAKTGDTDLDGLLDWWEWLNFGSLTFDATNDADGDGFTLAEEFQRDYEPLIKDRIVAGGVSRRQSALTAYVRPSPQLTILSDYGGAVPAPGSQLYDWEAAVTCQVTNSPVVAGATQYVCRGWSGSGSVPLTGTTTNTGAIILQGNSSVTWLWGTQYRLETTVAGGGSVDQPAQWVDAGSNVTITATASNFYFFAGWTGDTQGDTNAPTMTVAMDQPRLLQVNFTGPCQFSATSGPHAGGNTITITNGNFGTITNVLVGGVQASIQGSGANWVTITIPSIGSEGVKDIVVQTDNGDITLAGAYTVNPAGQISEWDWSRWDEVAGLPAPRHYHASAVLNGSLYAMGGHDGNPRANVYRYNGVNWTEVAALPTTRHGMAAGVLNGALYAIGGYTGGIVTTNVYRYNGTNWAEVAGLPAARANLAAGLLNGALYAVGGSDSSGLAATNVYSYNGTNWTELAGLPAARFYQAVGVLNGALYVVGGYSSSTKTNVYCYNGTNWAEVAGLPAARAYQAAGVLNGALYSVGGFSGNTMTNVYRYDGLNWTEVAGLPAARYLLTAGVLNGSLYAVGGSDSGVYFTNVFRYPAVSGSGVTPQSGSWTGGSSVVISGANLGNGSDITNVTLCGVAATILPGQSATQVVVTAGVSGAIGLGDVRVFSTSSGETVRSDAFTYLRESQVPLVFAPTTPQIYSTTNALSVSGGSGTGAVSYTVLSGPGLIVGGSNLTVTSGTGTVWIRATKAQDDLYYEASVTSSVVAIKADQTINFAPIAPRKQNASVGLSATANSGLAVSFAIGSGPGSISDGTNLTFTGVGDVEVVASQTGNDNFSAAPDVANIVKVFSMTTEVGPFAGGNTITITNGNFGTITNVLVGGVQASIQGFGAKWVTITTPATGSEGVQDILIQTITGDIFLAGAYTVNPAGKIVAVDWSRWDEVAGLPAARRNLRVVALKGLIYAVGGQDEGGALSSVYRYNGTNWAEVAGLPAARQSFGAEILNGALYVVGGWNGAYSTNVYRYNGTNWMEVAGLPAARSSLTAGVLNGSLYAIGGDFGGTARTNVFRYNGTNWTEIAGMPAARYELAAGVCNGSLYALGGYNGGMKTNVYRYNGANWMEEAGLPAARGWMAAGVLNGALYCIGGSSGAAYTANVYRYNGTNWTEAPALPAARGNQGAAMLDGALYSVGGYDPVRGLSSTNVYRYPAVVGAGVSPSSGSWTGGYSVVISGNNLGNGSDITNVTLCGVAATILPGQSSTQVVVTAGVSGVIGPGDVHVFSTSFGETVRPDAFTYLRENQSPLVFVPATPQIFNTTNALSVSGGSGTGAVSYTVLSGPGLIVDGTSLTVTSGTGMVSVCATKAQDELYYAASETSVVAAAKADQAISFPEIPAQLTTDAYELAASASSGLQVLFAVNSGLALIADGTNLSFTGAGRVRIIAAQAGDANYNAAPDVTNSFEVLARLTILSEHGTATPIPGTYTHIAGTLITNTVADPSASGTTQYVCTGWAMAGNEPTDGMGRIVVMTITNDATLTWLWKTQYRLDTAVNGGGSIDHSAQWVDAGSIVTISATASNHYHFAGWSGDTQGDTNALSITVNMDQPRSVTANFHEDEPVVAVSLTSLQFTGLVYSAIAPQMLVVSNAGGKSLDYTISSDVFWLSVGNASGVLMAEQSVAHEVRVATRGLEPRLYQGHLILSDAVATNSPQTISVSLLVTSPPPSMVQAWGRNDYGQTDASMELNNAVAVAGGEGHSLALRADGRVAAWGYNYFGQTNVPAGLSNAVAVAAGAYHSLAVKADGYVAAWGYNYFGQTNVPVSLTNAVAVAGGANHSLVLRANGNVAVWGNSQQTNVPALVTGVVAVACGSYHSLALRADGSVVAWGLNFDGQMNVPADLTNAVAVAGGDGHSLALRADGRVAAWGDNSRGQTDVPGGLTNVVAVAAGGRHSLALCDDGALVMWGDNLYGQADLPEGLTNVLGTAGGFSHSLALVPVKVQFCRTEGVNGVITGASNGWYTLGGSITVTAAPALYYHFMCWLGDVPSDQTNSNPLVLCLDRERAISAGFAATLATNNVPFWWLAQQGLSVNDEGALFEDGDGMPAWMEYIAGTDPTNPASVFRFTSVNGAAGQGMVVRWPSVSNRFYDLSRSTNLLAGTNSFIILPGASNLPATPTVNVYTDSVQGVGPYFYRINVHE